jgi:uncharacterized membrane protein YfcA
VILASELALLAGAGLVAGALNVVAGGGSFLTLPLLLFLGLPAAVANATNRVGVLAQNVSGVWGFHRHGALDWRWATLASLPAVAGAGLGAWLSLRVPDFAFTRILSVAMLLITLWSLWRSRGAAPAAGRPAPDMPGQRLFAALGFFVVGVYGGFIQAGVGFFILALTSAAGLDLVRGNAVKVWGVLLMTVLSLVIFAQSGTVDWERGAALGAGNFLGGIVGVRMAVLKGHRWLERVVTATVVLFALLLWTT